MTSVPYEEIYSSFYTKVQAYDFIELETEQLKEFLASWLHSTLSKPYVRRLFSSLTFDDDLESINFEMSYSIDESSDTDFIIEVCAVGMIVEWLSPKVNSIINISQMFGSKEEKFYSQSNHLSELRKLKDDSKKEQRRMIADRGYVRNTYLDGE